MKAKNLRDRRLDGHAADEDRQATSPGFRERP
jgi:hypothetical protein